jgi:hypothetical protein
MVQYRRPAGDYKQRESNNTGRICIARIRLMLRQLAQALSIHDFSDRL